MNTSETVLVPTCAEDATADAVIAELARRGTRVARINTGDFPTALRLNATTTDGGWSGRLTTDDTSVDLADVRAVYFRRPTRFRLPSGMSQADEVFAAVEARHGFGGLLASLDVLWVNEPIRQAAAEYKPLQSRQLGYPWHIRSPPHGISQVADRSEVARGLPGRP